MSGQQLSWRLVSIHTHVYLLIAGIWTTYAGRARLSPRYSCHRESSSWDCSASRRLWSHRLTSWPGHFRACSAAKWNGLYLWDLVAVNRLAVLTVCSVKAKLSIMLQSLLDMRVLEDEVPRTMTTGVSTKNQLLSLRNCGLAAFLYLYGFSQSINAYRSRLEETSLTRSVEGAKAHYTPWVL